MVGAAAITALGAVYADGLDGIAAACPERVNGKGLLDFSDVTIIAAFEELNRFVSNFAFQVSMYILFKKNPMLFFTPMLAPIDAVVFLFDEI